MIAIGDDIPGQSCIKANAHALARYAAPCQEAGLVPVVEPWRIHCRDGSNISEAPRHFASQTHGA